MSELFSHPSAAWLSLATKFSTSAGRLWFEIFVVATFHILRNRKKLEIVFCTSGQPSWARRRSSWAGRLRNSANLHYSSSYFCKLTCDVSECKRGLGGAWQRVKTTTQIGLLARRVDCTDNTYRWGDTNVCMIWDFASFLVVISFFQKLLLLYR